MSTAVFSDSWFRIAQARVGLLPTAVVQKQLFRGKPWYVLHDSYTHRYFRVTPETWAFISRLTPERTVEQIWLEFVQSHPDDAPGQEEIVRVLSQLHVGNLLYFQDLPDSQAIHARAEKQRKRELLGKLMAFLYVRVYLWNPDRWLDRHQRWIRFMVSPAALMVWVLVVASGIGVALEQPSALFDAGQGLFSLSNLPWLFVCLSVMKLLHEAGHAFVCKRYGGRVHASGIMFLILTPLPYVDMASTWNFKNRFHRVLVGSAGMMVELFLAAIGAIVWSQTSPGLINSLAYNMMVVGSVSSLLFNGNPLLRFDAYYILADLTDIPNLYQKAQQQWLYFGDRYLLGTDGAESPASDRREWWWFTVYGVLAFLYRIMITIGIVLFVLDQWFAVGLLMAVITVITMVLMPARKLLNHLSSARVHGNRTRARTVSIGLATGLLAAGALVPLPHAIPARGVLQAHQSSVLHAGTEGTLVSLAARSGDRLVKGDLIAELRNPELDFDIELAHQQLRESEQQLRAAIHRSVADISPVEKRIDALNQRLAELGRQREQLMVRAPHAGEWVGPGMHERIGGWVQRGQVLGELVVGERFRFVAVVPQEQADALFRHTHVGGKLRITGQAHATLAVDEFTLIPYQRERLQSSALGWMGGGEIAVKTGDQSGQTTAEPFFELHALVPMLTSASASKPAAALRPVHGLSGMLVIPLPAEPLFVQMKTALQQLFQKRYGV